MSVLETPPKRGLEDFARLLDRYGVDGAAVASVARSTLRYLEGDRERLRRSQQLERRWYASLDLGTPDYGVYASPLYLADLWACWILYSRRYLRSIQKRGLLAQEPRTVLDLGCGFGYTSAALSELLPRASVVGTNVPDALQTKIAEGLALDYHFAVVQDPEPAELVFASEYFEHFPKPIEHLREVLDLEPDALLVANTFGAASIGHFPTYEVDGEHLDGRATSRAFSAELRSRGYDRRETGLWNNRPAFWVKS